MAWESSLRRLGAARSPAYKWRHPSSLAPCSVAVRHGHLRDELPVPSRNRPCEHTTTTVNDHRNFPCCSRTAPAAPFAGARAPAAARQRRRRAAPPAVVPTRPSPEIEPRGPAGRSLAAPGRTRSPVRQNLAGSPPAGAEDHIARDQVFLRA
jgi:hypothetical protein